MHIHRHPLGCILPPHMLREIAERGTPAQRKWAIHTLRLTAVFLEERQAILEAISEVAPRLAGVKHRMVYDVEHGATLPGRLARNEGDPPSGDPAVDEAYEGSGASYDLYAQVYGRNSLDDLGASLVSCVHYQQGYDNAFWNGKQLVFGDGDENLPLEERLFNRFTVAAEIIGHELTHGVIQYEARLSYWYQSGALNESLCDVFGCLVKQRQLGQSADQADWIVGQGLFTENVSGVGIRSMKAPGTAYDDPVLGRDPQPAHMDDYRLIAYDNGGVHINSGIPNHAFYLAASRIGGYAWEKAGMIWYLALRDRLQSSADFQAAASATHQVAGELYGVGSLEQQAVKSAWGDVGLAVDSGSENPGCLQALVNLLAYLPERLRPPPQTSG